MGAPETSAELYVRSADSVPRMAVGAWYPARRSDEGKLLVCVDGSEREVPAVALDVSEGRRNRASIGVLADLLMAVCPAGHNYAGTIDHGLSYHCPFCRRTYVTELTGDDSGGGRQRP